MCCVVLSHSVVSSFCNLMDCSLPGSSVHGDSPGENIGGWVAMPSSRESSTLFSVSIFPSLASFFSFGVCNIGFPGGSVVKSQPANAGNAGLIPRSGSSPGKGNGNPLQNFCLGNLMDRGAWQATVHGVSESDITERLTMQSYLIYKNCTLKKYIVYVFVFTGSWLWFVASSSLIMIKPEPPALEVRNLSHWTTREVP